MFFRVETDAEETGEEQADKKRNLPWVAVGYPLVYNDIAPSISHTAPPVGVWRGPC